MIQLSIALIGSLIAVVGFIFAADYAIFYTRMSMEYGWKQVRPDRETCGIFLAMLVVGIAIVYISYSQETKLVTRWFL
jgi:hypothetical protein